MSTLYAAPHDHAPALRVLWSYPIARHEWHLLCREEGLTPSAPIWDDPTADRGQGKEASTAPGAGRTCGHCLNRFLPKSHSARFCCVGCRKAATAQREKEMRVRK